MQEQPANTEPVESLEIDRTCSSVTSHKLALTMMESDVV